MVQLGHQIKQAVAGLPESTAQEAVAMPHKPRIPRIDFSDAMPFKIDGEPCKLIDLTGGFFTIVDADIYEELAQFNWTAIRKESGFYAGKNGVMVDGEKQKNIYMHRLIMKTPPHQQCDHRKHNTFDNRRSQLRNCPKIHNTRNVKMHRDNRSGFKGVVWHDHIKKYSARIMASGTVKHLGVFVRAIDAARAYDAAALSLHGDFAQLNFPRENA